MKKFCPHCGQPADIYIPPPYHPSDDILGPRTVRPLPPSPFTQEIIEKLLKEQKKKADEKKAPALPKNPFGSDVY